MFRMRAPLSLVAVLLMIAVVVAVLVGGRLYQDWSSQHQPSPAHSSRPEATLAELEARPLTLPTVKVGDPCPQNPGTNSTGHAFGSGPVFADGSSPITTSWGNYFDIGYFTAPGVTGLVLIRGRDLRNWTNVVVFVGKYAAGPTVGSDPQIQQGVQHSEALLDMSHAQRPLLNKETYWSVRQGLPASASNCFGFQFDGTDFTETFTSGT